MIATMGITCRTKACAPAACARAMTIIKVEFSVQRMAECLRLTLARRLWNGDSVEINSERPGEPSGHFAGSCFLQKRFAEAAERFGRDRLSNSPHQVKVKAEVMDRVVHRSSDLIIDIKVPQIGPRHAPAGWARTVRIQRSRVAAEAGVLDRELPLAGKQRPVACV